MESKKDGYASKMIIMRGDVEDVGSAAQSVHSSVMWDKSRHPMCNIATIVNTAVLISGNLL